MFRRIAAIALTLILIATLAACGEADPTPTPEPPPTTAPATPVPTDTPAPTATPVPTNTPEPTPTPTPDPLPPLATLANETLGLVLSYPDTWAVDEAFGDDLIALASDDTLLGADDFDDGLVMFVQVSDAFGQPSSMQDVMATAILDDAETVVSGPDDLTINGHPAVRSVYETTVEDVAVAATFTTVINEDLSRAAIVIAFTDPAQRDEWATLIDAVSESVALLPPATETAVTTPDDIDRSGEIDLILDTTIEDDITDRYDTDFVANQPVIVGAFPGTDLDLVVAVEDADGNMVAESDSTFSSDPEGLIFLPPADGAYVVTVREFSGVPGPYSTAVSSAVLYETGALNEAGATAQFEFPVSAETGVLVLLNTGDGLDGVLRVLDSAGNVLAESDNALSDNNELLYFLPEVDDTVTLDLSGFADDTGSFTLAAAYTSVAPSDPTPTETGDNGTGLDSATIVENAPEEPGSEIVSLLLVEAGNEVRLPVSLVAGDSAELYVGTTDDATGVDATLYVEDGEGTVLTTRDVQSEDDLLTFTAETGDIHFFIIRNNSAEAVEYGVLLAASPLAIPEIVVGDFVAGRLADGADAAIEYAVYIEAWAPITVQALPEDALDIVVQLTDAEETVLTSIDSGFSGDAETALLDVPESGIYFIRVTSFDGAGGAFDLSLQP